MKLIETQVVPDQHKNQHTAGDAQSQADHVEGSEGAVLVEGSEGNGEVVG